MCMTKFVKEFRDFAVKGNVVDLAVGIIIGAAFGKIVSSIVADIIMPPLGLILGQVNFTDLKLVMLDAANGKAAVTLNYGNFLQTVVDFTIVAFAIFLLVRTINRMKKEAPPAPAAPAAPTPSETLLTEIRDLLKSGR